MNRSTVIGALCGLVAWILFLAAYGFLQGANDQFFRCERYNIGDAVLFSVELAAFLFPITIGTIVIGGFAGSLFSSFTKRGR